MVHHREVAWTPCTQCEVQTLAERKCNLSLKQLLQSSVRPEDGAVLAIAGFGVFSAFVLLKSIYQAGEGGGTGDVGAGLAPGSCGTSVVPGKPRHHRVLEHSHQGKGKPVSSACDTSRCEDRELPKHSLSSGLAMH